MSANEEGAFDGLLKKYPGLQAFSSKNEFFRPFILEVGHQIHDEATWLKLAISVGAASMSVADVLTDVYTTWYYSTIGKTSTATLMCVFVLLSFFLQVSVTVSEASQPFFGRFFCIS